MGKTEKRKKLLKDKVYEMPTFLARRFRLFLLLAAGTVVIGIPIVFTTEGARNILEISLIFAVVAGGFVLYSLFFRYMVTTRGYNAEDLTITYVKYAARLGKSRRAVCYHGKNAEGKIYEVPVFKNSVEAPVGAIIRIYYPHNTPLTESKGIYRCSALWGFELIGE